MSDFQKWSVLAFRAMDDAGRVLMTIEPESTTEGERLDQLKATIRELLMQCVLLNGLCTRRQLDERFGFGKLDTDALNVQLGQQQQAEPDRRDLQAAGTHPAPCARHCEARAFEIEIRSLNSRLKQQAEPVHGDIRALKYRIHELEGEVMGYKRMLDVEEAASQPQQQAEPVAWEHHAKKLTHWLHCMPYNDSYFGEPAGLVKQVTAELNRLIGTALRSALEQPERQAEPVHGDIRALKYRIHELEGEVMGYKRMLDVAEAASQPQQQAEPVFENLDYVAVVYSPSNAMLKNPLPIGTHLYKYPPLRKPLTDEQIDAGVKAWFENPIVAGRQPFAKRMRAAIEAAHGIQEPKQ